MQVVFDGRCNKPDTTLAADEFIVEATADEAAKLAEGFADDGDVLPPELPPPPQEISNSKLEITNNAFTQFSMAITS